LTFVSHEASEQLHTAHTRRHTIASPCLARMLHALLCMHARAAAAASAAAHACARPTLRPPHAATFALRQCAQAKVLTPAKLRQHLMLFVDATVDNPEFDSQSKEALTTPAAGFGGGCLLPAKFVSAVAALPGLKEAITERVTQGEFSALARATRSSARSPSLNDVKKLEDAEDAGGPNAHEVHDW
jgi:hypothetical protein